MPIAEQIETIAGEIDALQMAPEETHSLLYYLAGAEPRAMRDGLRYVRDTRVQTEMRRAWKACPNVDRWPTHMQHDRSCRTCQKEK